MRKRLLIALLAASASIFAAAITDGFEGEQWGHWNMPGCKLQYQKNANEGIQDTACAEIDYLPGSKGKNEGTYVKDFPLTPGKQYSASIMFRNAVEGKKGTVLFFIDARGSDGKSQKQLLNLDRNLSQEWVRLSGYFTMPAEAVSAKVHLRASAEDGSRVLFDNFAIREFTPADVYTEHYDSAKSISSWKNPKSKVTIGFEENEGKEAKGCVKYVIPEGNPKQCGGCATLRLPVEKGKEYTFLVQAKSIGFANDAQIGMHFQGLDEKNGFLGTGVQGTGIKAEDCRDWKRIVFSFQIPTTGKWEKCAKMLVTLNASGDIPGTAFFDDFQYFLVEEE